jgi:hypothetical protein
MVLKFLIPGTDLPLRIEIFAKSLFRPTGETFDANENVFTRDMRESKFGLGRLRA